MGEWQSVIGLEIHVQLATTSKIFSAVPTDSEGAPNTHVDPVTLLLTQANGAATSRAEAGIA